MAQKIISGSYKTIYYRFKNEGKKLIVILPRAGAQYESHKELVNKLGEFGSILFIETGYFGISKADGNTEDLSIHKFGTNLHELINSLGFNKAILIGESVGAIHALSYSSTHNDDVEYIILSNPALYRQRGLYDLLIIPVLDLGIRVSSDKFLKRLGKLLIKVPDEDINKVGKAFVWMSKTTGASSYLACLKEIDGFTSRYKANGIKHLLAKTYVLAGRKDKVFQVLCDKEYCEDSKEFIEVASAGHDIIDLHPDNIVGLLKGVM